MLLFSMHYLRWYSKSGTENFPVSSVVRLTSQVLQYDFFFFHIFCKGWKQCCIVNHVIGITKPRSCLTALTVCVPSLQIFSIVVFATITAEGYINPTSKEETKCMFNNNDSACSYGVGIGVLAFLACVVFLILDAYFPQISNAKERKYIVIGDLAFSGESQVSL